VLLSNLPPRPYERFVGRKKIIQELIRLLRKSRKGRTPAVLVYGPSGVGKTSLVIEVAYVISARCILTNRLPFEAVVWISAQPQLLTIDGFLSAEAPSRTLYDVIDVIAIVLRRDSILRASPDRKISLIHRALAEQRSLLIFDNLEMMPDERVFAFLRGVAPGTGVLATSREAYDFDLSIQLPPLTAKESKRLMEQTARHKRVSLSEEDRNELLELATGVPLRIVWSIAVLRYGYPMEEIRRSFKETDSDFNSFCFGKAWQLISRQPAGALLSGVGFFPTDSTREALGYVAGLENEPAKRDEGLALLERLSLVTRHKERFNTLPMIRDYVARVLTETPEKEQSIRQRLLQYLRRYAERSLMKSTWDDVFAELDLERENLLGVLNWAAKQDDRSLREQAAVLFATICYYLFSRGYWSVLTSGKEWVAGDLLRQNLLVEYLDCITGWIARVYILQGRLREARGCCIEAEHVLESRRDVSAFHRALLLFHSSSIDRRLRESEKARALDALEKASAVFRERHEYVRAARALIRAGNCYAELGEYDCAEELYSGALSISRLESEVPASREMVATAKGSLGILANRRRKFDLAVEFLRQCEPFMTQLMDKAVVFMELGIASHQLGRRAAALKWGQKAEELKTRLEVDGAIAESDPAWEKEVLPRLQQRPRRWLYQMRWAFRRGRD